MRKREARDWELARLADYLERAPDQKHLLPIIAYAHGMADRQPKQRAQILSMITILEGVVQLFRSPVSQRLAPRLSKRTNVSTVP